MNIKRILAQHNVLDFGFNPQKNLISLLTPSTNELLRIKNQQSQSPIKLIKSTPHNKYFKQFFKQNSPRLQKQYKPTTDISLFLHHSVYKTDYYLHVDQDYLQFKQQINNLQIDPYGLITLSSGNAVYLCKYINDYNNDKNTINQGGFNMKKHKPYYQGLNKVSSSGKKIHPLAELKHHHDFKQVSTYYTKNSLLISGSHQGMVALWDINKSKQIYHSQYLKYSIKNIGIFLNFKDINLYYANYGNFSDKIIFCDIRTNKPIKIVNQFNANLNCKITKKGILIGINQNSLDFIQINSGFKQAKIQTNQQKQSVKKNIKSTKNLKTDIFQKQNKSVKFNDLNRNKLIDQLNYNNSCVVNFSQGEGYLNQYQMKMTASKFGKKIKTTNTIEQKIIYNPNRVLRNLNGLQSNKKISQKNVYSNILSQQTERTSRIQKQLQYSGNKCCLMTQNSLFFGQNNGKILVLNHQNLQELQNRYSDQILKGKKTFEQINLPYKQSIVKLVENYFGIYALTHKGNMFKIQTN